MSKKPTIADYKQRAELAEAQLKAVLDNLDRNVSIAEERVETDKIAADVVQRTRENALRAMANVRIPVTK